MTQRITNLKNCYPCTLSASNHQILVFSDGIQKCCPSVPTACKNCTQKTRLTRTCADCPAGQVWNDETNTCISASSCTGLINNDICFKIPDGQLIQESYYDQDSGTIKTCNPSYYIQEGKCVDKCREGYYEKDKICLKCKINFCNICDEMKCIKCEENMFLYRDGTCGNCDTQNGYFIDGNYCSSCDISCKTCKGPSQSHCTSCQSKYYKAVKK